MVPRAPLPRQRHRGRTANSPTRAVMTVTDPDPAPVTPRRGALSAVSHSGAGARRAGSRRRHGRSLEAVCGVRRAGLGSPVPSPPLARDLHWPVVRLACRGAYGCEVGLPVACGVGWEVGGPVGWEAGGPFGWWEAFGPAGWELWEDDAPGCGTAAQ